VSPGLAPALAAAPLAAVLGLMLGLRWRAAHAGLAGLGVAAVLAVTIFGFGVETPTPGPTAALGGVLAEALFAAGAILWIIFPALALYELQNRSGALQTLRSAVAQVSDERRVQVILVAFFFGLFMEGVAGFGTPIALTAPLLVGLGIAPVRAVVLALVGHAAGVSFGALGTPVLAQAALLPFAAEAIARETALLSLGTGWLLLGFLIWASGGRRPAWSDWLNGALAAACFFIPYLALAFWTGPELPTVGGAMIGGTIFAAIIRRGRSGRAPVRRQDVARAALPYAMIVIIVLLTRLIPPVQNALQSVELEWSLMETFGGRFQPLYHPGGVLALGLVLGGLAQGRGLADLAQAAVAALHRLGPVAVALVAMLALSRLMVHAGMIEALATAATGAAAIWPLAAPFVGVLGSFVTGSATASNILLTPFQSSTAAALDLPPVRMAAAQGFGAGIGNIVCPHNVIAGSATVGIQGKEGDILRATILPCIIYAAAGGMLLFLTL